MEEDSIAVNFKKVAAENPELAWEISHAVISSASSKSPDGVQGADIHPIIVEYHASQNVYENTRDSNAPSWSGRPSTSWLHVLCNGGNTAFASHCKGMLSANVRFGQEGTVIAATTALC